MTPKEKAKELVDKFNKTTTYQYQEYAGAHPSTWEMDKDDLKLCATICVDEIIESNPKYPTKEGYDNYGIIYWQEVKQEIELL